MVKISYGVSPTRLEQMFKDPRAALLERHRTLGEWWWAQAYPQLRVVNPNLDASNPQLALLSDIEVIKKAITTGTAGAFNPLFSYLIQSQVVTEPNTYNFLPKAPFRGPRTLGYRMQTTGGVAGKGIAEGLTTLGADRVLNYLEITPTLKEHNQVWSMSRRMIDAVTITDSVEWDDEIEAQTLDFFKGINLDIWTPLATVESPNMEGLRNLLSSNSELTGKALAANSIDPWLDANLDRDAGASFADANTIHNSGTDLTLAVKDIEQLRELQEPFWEGPDKLANKLYVTGYNTASRWAQLEASKQRFNAEGRKIQQTVNGVRSAEGEAAGYKIATWDGMTMLRDDDMTTETIKDIALLDMNHVELSELRPFEMVDSEDPFVVGFNRKALWYGAVELTMDFFKVHGVLTDRS